MERSVTYNSTAHRVRTRQSAPTLPLSLSSGREDMFHGHIPDEPTESRLYSRSEVGVCILALQPHSLGGNEGKSKERETGLPRVDPNTYITLVPSEWSSGLEAFVF